MAQVSLLSAAAPDNPGRPYAFDELERMKTAARLDKFGVHEATDDWEQADVILFVENCGTFDHFFHEVRHHPAYRKYPGKCCMHTRTDYPVPFLPGVYASLRKRWYDPERVRTGMYLVAHDHDYVSYSENEVGSEYLYSFIGKTNTRAVRQQIMELDDGRAFLFDTTPYWPYGELPAEKREELEAQYREVSLKSQFILCPRGYGTSSIRLFEALRMGRVPVVLADAWVPPEGPAWDSFCVRIPESEVHLVPQILEERCHQAADMGRRARQAWDDWFSEHAIFHRVTEWCLAIRAERRLPETMHRWRVVPQLLQPLYMKALARTLLPVRVKNLLNTIKP